MRIHKKGRRAGAEIRTQGLLRDQTLNLAPLTELGYPRMVGRERSMCVLRLKPFVFQHQRAIRTLSHHSGRGIPHN
jgi:hypothetical protein